MKTINHTKGFKLIPISGKSLKGSANPIELLDINNQDQFNLLIKSISPLLLINKLNLLYTILSNDIVNNKIVLSFKPLSLELWDELDSDYIYSTFPLFFKNREIIKIPAKVERVLERYTPKELLQEIDKNKDVAVEYCLMFLTRLAGTYYISQDTEDKRKKEGWKPLQAKFLADDFSPFDNCYKKIIDALMYPSVKGAILERDNNYIVGNKCFHYRLGEAYRLKGVKEYVIKTEAAKSLLNKQYYKAIARSVENPICRNLCNIYSNIQLPTIEQIKKRAKELINENYQTKKGKKLTFLNKHSRSYFKDVSSLSFVEDSIEIFEYLTSNGYMIPQESGEKNGGRIIDSFTLMPSWIRNMCKIDGQFISECDYSTLHPNIAAHIYGANSKYITHAQVANDLKKDLKEIKIEHLSFFNKTWEEMSRSPLFSYYWTKEPEMMEAIEVDKRENKIFYTLDKHKITSQRMFGKETEIMTLVIEKLNKEKIYVGYIYDALFCHPKDKARVIAVMNQIILEEGVYTIAK